jgi:predicted nuclease of predicted toxin-antitoxin system
MSSSISERKFLLDENVHSKLQHFLIAQGYNVSAVPKGAKNGVLAAKSKTEKRIFVTNDSDFSAYPKESIFCVIWLRIPQYKPEALIASFTKLLKSITNKDLTGTLVILKEGSHEIISLHTKR